MSVVLIFLNEERFLAEAIESVRAQTYGDWELLLCDDGSTDASAAIAADYVKLDERIRYVTHPGRRNRGMSATRNLGARESNGKLIALLDGDDVLLPQMLERQVTTLNAHEDVAMACGACEYWQSWSGPQKKRDAIISVGAVATPVDGVWQQDAAPPLALTDSVVYPPQLLTTLYPLGLGASPATCTTVIRRDAYEALGGYEERFTGFLEDQAFALKLYLRYPVYISSECFARYRQHAASSVSTTMQSGAYSERFRGLLDWFATYLDSEEDVPLVVQAALNDTRVRALEQLLDERNRQLASASDELAATIDAFHRSASWRIAAPVRSAGTSLRRLRQRVRRT